MDYAGMAADYDAIMQRGNGGRGYYDYAAVADRIAAEDARDLLELGAGTGLVLEQVLKRRGILGQGLEWRHGCGAYATVTGIDVTREMLAGAAVRLEPWPDVRLVHGDVTRLDLGRGYDLAFSQGGPWYFVPEGGSWAMVSHIPGDRDNIAGLSRVAGHLAGGGRLLLGIQKPHRAYSEDLGDGTTYEQAITAVPGGFLKTYRRRDNATGRPRMETSLPYRVFPWPQALAMLARCGLSCPAWQPRDLFVTFTRRP